MENLDTLQEILNVPYGILLSFGIGYISYWLAYHGYELNDSSKNYKILIFSLPGLFILSRKVDFEHLIYVLLTLVISLFWRKLGRKLLEKLLFTTKISNSNGYDKIIQDIGKEMENGLPVGKVIVYLNNGTKLVSILEQDRHKNKPIEHFKIDIDGNMLIYVDEVNGNMEQVDPQEIVISYIPKESIKCFDLIASKKNK